MATSQVDSCNKNFVSHQNQVSTNICLADYEERLKNKNGLALPLDQS